jgi:hypothetical protein
MYSLTLSEEHMPTDRNNRLIFFPSIRIPAGN